MFWIEFNRKCRLKKKFLDCLKNAHFRIISAFVKTGTIYLTIIESRNPSFKTIKTFICERGKFSANSFVKRKIVSSYLPTYSPIITSESTDHYSSRKQGQLIPLPNDANRDRYSFKSGELVLCLIIIIFVVTVVIPSFGKTHIIQCTSFFLEIFIVVCNIMLDVELRRRQGFVEKSLQDGGKAFAASTLGTYMKISVQLCLVFVPQSFLHFAA